MLVDYLPRKFRLAPIIAYFALTNTAAAVAPAITQNPANVTVNAGATAQFTAAASGSPAPSVQWQQSTNGGAVFSDIAGATSATLSFVAAAGQDGYQFRAVFTNASATATTTAATLTVHSPPAITQNPVSATFTAGATAQFTAAASGNLTPNVQWQQSTDGGSTFTNVTGATSTSLSFTAASAQNGYEFRAVFTNSTGSATSTVATLTVQTGPAVTQNPANLAVNAGGTAQFTAAASGAPAPTVQWQQSTNGGAVFSDIAGATSSPLSFVAAAGQDGYQFRAVFSNASGTATTTAATLTVHSAPAVTQNPVSATFTAGATAQFTAAASGNPTPNVQWQQSTDGGNTFTNVAGATSTTLSFPAASAQNGYRFRAVFTNSTGSATTTAATLTVQAQAACDPTGDGRTNIADVQLIVTQALGVAPAANDLTGDGALNVIDVQIETNMVLGLGCSMTTTMTASSPPYRVAPVASGRNANFDPGLPLPNIVTDLGTVGGLSTTAYGINNLGQIVGASGSRAFLWDAGRMTALDVPVDGNATDNAAFSIDDSGQIAGDYWRPGQPGGSFLYAAGHISLLPNAQDSRVSAINNAGQIVGDLSRASATSSAAFLWKAGTMTALETYGGGGAHASAINDVGQVVGFAYVRDNSALHAFLYDGVASTDLGTLGGTNSFAFGINVAGQVVGSSQTTGDRLQHAFLYSRGLMTDLGTLGGAASQADGINSRGLIVGWATTTSGDRHAFLWSAERMLDLNSLASLGTDAVLVEATAINDVGQLIANGSNGRAYSIVLPAQLR